MVATLRPSCPSVPGPPPDLGTSFLPWAHGTACECGNDSSRVEVGLETAPGSVLHNEMSRSVARLWTFSPHTPVQGSPETISRSSPIPTKAPIRPCVERSAFGFRLRAPRTEEHTHEIKSL